MNRVEMCCVSSGVKWTLVDLDDPSSLHPIVVVMCTQSTQLRDKNRKGNRIGHRTHSYSSQTATPMFMATMDPAACVFLWQEKTFARGQGEGLAGEGEGRLSNAWSPHQFAKHWKDIFLEGRQEIQSLLSLNSLLPTFVCDSRFAALTHLAPRLTSLDDGTLSGQSNAFILVGTRGVGKTRFIKSLFYVVAKMAKPSTFTIYCNYKSSGVVAPAQLLVEAMRELYPDIATLLMSESMGLSDVLRVMYTAKLRCFLIIDEVEELYKLPADSETADRVYRQLHVMGEMDCERPIFPLLTGSAAALRPLLYSKRGHDLKELYPCYLRFSSLNNRKYQDLVVRPLTTEADTVQAVLAISSNQPLRQTLIETGRLMRADHGTGNRDCIVDGLRVSPDHMAIVSSKCRGLASHIRDAIVGRQPIARGVPFQNQAIEVKQRLKRLVDAWIESLGGCSPALAAAKMYDSAIVSFGMDLTSDENTSVWFQMMDEGLVYFDVDSLRVQFLHPSDASALLVA